jgi:hypothetical protein
MDEVDDFLEHYGVKGMQWGVRRTRAQLSEDASRARQLKKRSVSSLSNQELKIVNERRNLEQNYTRLNPGVVRRGEMHAKGVIAAVGLATALANLATTPFGQAAIRGGQRFADRLTSLGLNDIRLTN